MGKVTVNDDTRKDIDMIKCFLMDRADCWKVDVIKEIIIVTNQTAHFSALN